MKEAEKEAERIIEMFLNVKSYKINDHSRIEYPTAKQCAILHVEGILEALELHQWQNRKLIEHHQQVKQAIENK